MRKNVLYGFRQLLLKYKRYFCENPKRVIYCMLHVQKAIKWHFWLLHYYSHYFLISPHTITLTHEHQYLAGNHLSFNFWELLAFKLLKKSAFCLVFDSHRSTMTIIKVCVTFGKLYQSQSRHTVTNVAM